MKWPGEAIWSILLPKNQTETKKFHFPFFHCFSPLSWSQVLELLWDHCVLTQKSFWIVQVDFLDLIFHLKQLPEHSWKILVMMKNQGTFYLKHMSVGEIFTVFLCKKLKNILPLVGVARGKVGYFLELIFKGHTNFLINLIHHLNLRW